MTHPTPAAVATDGADAMIGEIAEYALRLKMDAVHGEYNGRGDLKWSGAIYEAMFESIWGGDRLEAVADELLEREETPRPTDYLFRETYRAAGDEVEEYGLVLAAVYERLGLEQPESREENY